MVVRILVAGFLGGIIIFAWTSSAAHGAAFGEAGVFETPNESAALSAIQSNIGDRNGQI
jgi:hypothetical protein